MNALETRSWRWTRKRILWLGFVVVLLAGALIRHFYYPIYTADISYYYTRWLNYFQRFGLAAAFNPDTDYNYSMTFACIFTLYARLFGAGNVLMLMKLTGCALEAVTVGLCLLLLLTVLPRERKAEGALLGLALLWLNPVMIWNVAAWGQTDVYYLLFSVLSVLLLIRDRPGWAITCLGIAFTLKLQAVFLAPLFVMAWFCGRKRFSCLWFLMLPAIMLLSGLPALFVGESPLATLKVYQGQSEQYGGLSMNKYNLFTLIWPVLFSIDDGTVDMFCRTGIVLCAAALGGMLVWMIARKVELTGRETLLLAAWCVLCCGFLLPRMHERYAIVGEVLLCCWAVCFHKPRGYLYVLAVLLPTVGTYANSLFDATFVDAQLGGAVSLIALCALTWEVTRELRAPHEAAMTC